MQCAHDTERRFSEIGRPICYKGSNAMSDFHDAHCSQISNSCAKTGAANLKRPRKFTLRWDLVARLQRTIFNEGTNVVDHLRCSMMIGRILHSFRHIGRTPSCNTEFWRTTRLAPKLPCRIEKSHQNALRWPPVSRVYMWSDLSDARAAMSISGLGQCSANDRGRCQSSRALALKWVSGRSLSASAERNFRPCQTGDRLPVFGLHGHALSGHVGIPDCHSLMGAYPHIV